MTPPTPRYRDILWRLAREGTTQPAGTCAASHLPLARSPIGLATIGLAVGLLAALVGIRIPGPTVDPWLTDSVLGMGATLALWILIGSDPIEGHAHCDVCGICSIDAGIHPAASKATGDRDLSDAGWATNITRPGRDLAYLCPNDRHRIHNMTRRLDGAG